MSEKTTKKKAARKRPSKAAKPPQVESHSETAASVEAASSPEPEVSEAVVESDPYEGKLYEISSWKGLPNYECKFCAYATVDYEAALEHAADVHAPPDPKPEIINTGLVDVGGDPITRAERPAKEE